MYYLTKGCWSNNIILWDGDTFKTVLSWGRRDCKISDIESYSSTKRYEQQLITLYTSENLDDVIAQATLEVLCTI